MFTLAAIYENFLSDVISSKGSQIELQSSRKSDNVLAQYPDSKIPPIYSIREILETCISK